MSTPFDPRPHLRQLDSGALYLDVKWRMHWLRSEHPEAQIETQLLSTEGDIAVCKATVRLPEGGSATGHASVPRTQSASYIEQAETRAIGRALAALGYGAEYADEDQVQGRPVERPVSLVPPPTQSTPARSERSDRTGPAEQPATPVQFQQPERVRPVREESGDERRGPREVRETAEPEAAPPIPTQMGRGSDLRRGRQQQSATSGEAAPEDVSWTKFWEWAKRRGYRDAGQLKDLLGIEVGALTPAEVRDHIRRYELDNPPGEG